MLEVGDAGYTRRFGGERVTGRRRQHRCRWSGDHDRGGSGRRRPHSRRQLRLLVITQTLHLVFDLPAAVATLERILVRGAPCWPRCRDRPAQQRSVGRHLVLVVDPVVGGPLFRPGFGADNVEVGHHGNVLTSVAFLQGMAAHELRRSSSTPPTPSSPCSSPSAPSGRRPRDVRSVAAATRHQHRSGRGRAEATHSAVGRGTTLNSFGRLQRRRRSAAAGCTGDTPGRYGNRPARGCRCRPEPWR